MESTEACLTLLYKSLKLPLNEAFGCIYGQSGLPVSLLNGVIDCRLKNKDLNAAVKFITGHFRKLGLPHSWWIEASKDSVRLKDALAKEGLELWGMINGMRIDLHDTPLIDKQNDLEIVPIKTKEELFDWSGLVCKIFDLQGKLAEAYTLLYQNIGCTDSFIHLVGKKKGDIISAGSVLCHKRDSYLFNICTLEEERNRGYAAAIMQKLLNIAKSKGAMQAALQSSPLTAPFYSKLGFQEVCQFNVYASTP